jgi:hypothetical protein
MLTINSFAAVVVGLDGEDPILLLGDAAAAVGNGNDIMELLADVGRDYNSCLSSLSSLSLLRLLGSDNRRGQGPASRNWCTCRWRLWRS